MPLQCIGEVYILSLNNDTGEGMKAKIQKWGNSLGVRIPRALAQETSVESDSLVDIVARNGKIIITPFMPTTFSLRQLLSKITDDNRHEEISTGASAGKEAW
jgi:antitoxin MazE